MVLQVALHVACDGDADVVLDALVALDGDADVALAGVPPLVAPHCYMSILYTRSISSSASCS